MSSEPDYLNASYERSITFDDNYKTIKITTPNQKAAEDLRDSLMMDIDFAQLEGRDDKDDYQIEITNPPQNNIIKISGELTTALKDLLNSGFITKDKEKELRVFLGDVTYKPKDFAARAAFYRSHPELRPSRVKADKQPIENGLSKKP